MKKDIQKPIFKTAKKVKQLSPFAKNLIADFDKQNNPINRFKFQTPKHLGDKNNEINKMTTDSGLTFDDSSLPINNCGNINLKQIEGLTNSWFMGYPIYSYLSQNGIVQNIIQSYADNCVRKWIKIKTRSNNLKSDKSQKIAELYKAMELPQFKVRENYRLALEMCIMFGGCQLYHKIAGDDSEDGGEEYQTPLYMEKVEKGSLLYLKVIEPLYASPLGFNTTEPLKENYYKPIRWNILGKLIHHTRLCHFTYNYVPTLLKPIYWFNGYPLIQLVLSYLIGFESIRKEIINIVSRYNINVFKTSLAPLLDYDAGSTFKDGEDCFSRLKLAQAIMTNFSIFALDNNREAPEEWQQFNMTIAGLSDILSQNAELICAVAREPAIILYGTSPKGFNSTGDIELNVWHETIHNLQEKCIRPNLSITMDLLQMHLYGEIDSDIVFDFEPLKELSELEKSQIRVNDSIADSNYVNSNILSPLEIREKLIENTESGFNNLMSNKEFEKLFNEIPSQVESSQSTEDYNGKN